MLLRHGISGILGFGFSFAVCLDGTHGFDFTTSVSPKCDGLNTPTVTVEHGDSTGISTTTTVPVITTSISSFTDTQVATLTDTTNDPEPSANPLNNTSVAKLIRTMQDRILREYEIYATFSCLHSGRTLNCNGPWLYGNDWNKDTLTKNMHPSTSVDNSYTCSFDHSYLQPASLDRVFYGFTSANITSSLDAVAHFTSSYAAGVCTMNETCAALYRDDTEQMYSDFRFYINSTFFSYMRTALPENESLAFCPDSIYGMASLFQAATSHFDGGKEYFGLHNPIFLPGVSELINGTVEEARVELGLMLANNARKLEGVFLNMVFFNYDKNHLSKRSEGDEEVYPGCARRDWVREGQCKGIVPPRRWDLTGEVIPMKDRDEMEVYGYTSHALENTGLVARGTCDAQKNSIDAHIMDFKTAKLLADGLITVFATIPEFIVLVESTAPVAIITAALGIAVAISSLAMAECETFNTCNGVPPAFRDIAKVFTRAKASKNVSEVLALTGKVEMLKVLGKLQKYSGLAAFVLSSYVDKILDDGRKYYEEARHCCDVNCDSAVCTQASLFCFLSPGGEWADGHLDCTAV